MLRKIIVALIVFFSSFEASYPASPRAGKLVSPQDLWNGYDPTTLPLDQQMLRSWEEAGSSFQKLFFTSELADGVKVRIFAIQGAPTGGKRLPGVLHIHGGGQTASLEWVRFWVKRGYACVSFDFCGKWENRKEFTDWGPIKHANMAHAQGGYQVKPTPRASSWFHWSVAARRALTLLARHPAADPDRLGIFGVSVGGTLCWMVAGSDSRVKASVPIYGCGYNIDRRKVIWDFGEPSPENAYWKQVVSPEAHAPYITCPVLFLSATNDHHGWMDDGYEILHAVQAPVRQAFTPRYIHHVGPEQGVDLPRWMDWHLKQGTPWPESPQLTIRLDTDGIPRATVKATALEQIDKVEIYYALGVKIPQARFWRGAHGTRHESHWSATLPVMDVWDDLLTFANVTYSSGVCLSSNLTHTIPAQLGKARATLTWSATIDDGRTGADGWFYAQAYTDPVIDQTFFRTGKGKGRENWFTPNAELLGDPVAVNIASHVIGDPQHRGHAGLALTFDCRGAFDDRGLTVSVCERDWSPRAKTFNATVRKEAMKPEWNTMIFPLSRFASEDGQRPAGWRDLDKVQIRGFASRKDPPCFTNFRWMAEGSLPQ